MWAGEYKTFSRTAFFESSLMRTLPLGSMRMLGWSRDRAEGSTTSKDSAKVGRKVD